MTLGGGDGTASTEGLGWKVFGLLALVALNGFFVAAEFALVRLRETQLQPLLKKGHRRAGIARRLIQNIEACLSATQLGITFCGLGLGAMAAPVFEGILTPAFRWFDITSPSTRRTTAIIFGFLVNTLLLIVVGELVPKALAIRRTLSTSLWIAQPLEWFYRLTYPFIWLLNHAAQWILNWLGIEAGDHHAGAHSEDEMRVMLASSTLPGSGSSFGRGIVLNAFDLRRRIVRQVMRPRNEVVGLDTEASMEACMALAEQTRFSRFPLCEQGDIDRTLGIVHIKDLHAMRKKARTGADLGAVCRGLVYVPPTARLERVLQLLLDKRLHMAIVVDEHGGTIGLITLENILEELVGQIQDEFDQEKPLLVRLDERTWEASGALPLHDLGNLVGEPLAADGIATVSGFLTARLGGFPKRGEKLAVGGFELVVEETDGPRVERLKIRRVS